MAALMLFAHLGVPVDIASERLGWLAQTWFIMLTECPWNGLPITYRVGPSCFVAGRLPCVPALG